MEGKITLAGIPDIDAIERKVRELNAEIGNLRKMVHDLTHIAFDLSICATEEMSAADTQKAN